MGLTADIEIVTQSFDGDYYRSHYQDIARAKCDPVRHYCEHGWREGRNPSAHFDTRFYLEENADVERAGVNPFVHYLQRGRAEGRKPKRMGTGTFRIASARSAAEQSLGWSAELGLLRRLTASDLLLAIAERGLVVAVSHDDYGVSLGGVQNVLGEECAEFNRRGMGFLHVCPMRPVRSLGIATSLSEFQFAARYNGQALGRVDGLALREVVSNLAARGTAPHWVLHHLMGHAPEIIEQLVHAGCADAPLFWTHDYFSACSSYALLRNDVTFCHGPPLDSAACRICAYGRERGNHMARIRRLLESVQPTIVAPSHGALALWLRATGFAPSRAVVVSPARPLLVREHRSQRCGPLRVAYLGGLAYHKGWDAFRELAEAFQTDERYEFFQLGVAPTGVPKFIHQVHVQVTGTDRDAMVRAVARHRIDVVVCWSLCPETFNFTVHEAIAAGAYVIARREQGNVWPAAQAHAPLSSYGVDDAVELERLFRSGVILTAVDASPRYRGALLPSMGSAELIALEPLAQEVTEA